MLGLAALGVLTGVFSVITSLSIAVFGKGSALHPAHLRLRPVILVTCAWASLFYVFLFAQSCAAFYVKGQLRKANHRKKDDDAPENKNKTERNVSLADVKYRNKGTKLNLICNRTVGNYMEQSGMFLVSLWLSAILHDPFKAATAGWVWLAFRAIYPIVFTAGPFLFLSTIPAYVCVFYLLVTVWYECW